MAKKKTGKVVVKHPNISGGSREYSEAVHGKDYEKLAKSFADQHEGAVVVPVE